MRKLIALLLAGTIILGGLAGCATTESSAIGLVPESSNLVALVQVSRIAADQDLKDAYARSRQPDQPATLEEALDKLAQDSGIDLRGFAEILVFGKVEDDSKYFGLIIEGKFDPTSFVSNVEQKSGVKLTTSEYKGEQIYSGKAEKFAFTFMNNKRLVVGEPAAVKDVIDVSKGTRQPLKGAVIDAYNRLDASLVKLAMSFPEKARQELARQAPGGAPVTLKSFGEMDVMGFAFNKVSKDLSIKVNAHFLSTDAAKDAKDALSGMVSLMRGMLNIPEVKELLGKIEVSQSESWVNIDLDTTLGEMEKLVGVFAPKS